MVAAEQRRRKEEEAKRTRLQKLEGEYIKKSCMINFACELKRCQTFMNSK